ncbi:SpoIIE family protein phosphatase [Leptospira sp. GIMC2001]|uniref:SpoIIE family protein phosphatase n=1 Tax=Leptospira sp. GIMC2001 TaxID=1513297 RepID=UPI00234B1132|nr:SpoIIE family protein phosphatase [Leptospira sp. GIMC2001]WCL49202.1 SpoIIE family protein phosphatase [Leptospira sp. GIMC2001]
MIIAKNHLNKIILLCYILNGICSTSIFADGQNPRIIESTDIEDGMELSPYFTIIEDRKQKYKPQDLLQELPLNGFIISDGRIPNYGSTSSAYWFRWRIHNSSEETQEYIVKIRYPLLDQINLYYNTDEGLVEKKSGRIIRSIDKEIPYRGSAFTLTIPPSSIRSFILRVETRSSMSVPVNLWTKRGFYESVTSEQMLQGLFFGAIIVMLFYNLFLYVSLRDRGYLYYVIYLSFASFLFQLAMNGYLGLYLFPESTYVQMNLHNTIYILSLLTVFPLIRYVLNMKKYFPLMDRILGYMFFLCFIAIALDFVLPYSWVNQGMDIFAMTTIILSIIACYVVTAKGYRPAYYFFCAFILVMIGGMLALFKYMGALPVNFFTENTYQMSMGLEVILMGFALADRIQLMEREKQTNRKQLQTYQSELEIARKLQESTLPATFPSMTNLQISVKYKPMSYVGGDFYDFHQINDHQLMVLIADVTGHGIPAAFEAAMLKVAFSVEKNSGKSPSEILQNLNTILIHSYNNQLLTATLALLDLDERKLVVANAGHPSMLLRKRKNDELIELRPKGSLIGFKDVLELDEVEHKFESGDRLVLYTDGLVDGIHPFTKEMFGEDRLIEIIKDSDQNAAAEAVDRIINAAGQWAQKETPDDDMTLIVIDIL